MWLLQAVVLLVGITEVHLACRGEDIVWQPWSQCSYSCGGGVQYRIGYTCTRGIAQSQNRACNEFCYNGGDYTNNNGCRCKPWQTGFCCEKCLNIDMPHCKIQKCDGSPNNIKCAECTKPYTPLGWGKGCRRLTCVETNGGCEHTCLMERGIAKCSCRSGFRLSSNSYSCSDIDECTLGTANCDHRCTNTAGSFQCSCFNGSTLDSDRRTCSDIDECMSGEAKCDQKCINTRGSFYCSCNTGYNLSTNGRTCIDLNECNNNNGGCSHGCINELGSFHCKCQAGYNLEAGGLLCTDVDECSKSTSKCFQLCHNTPGTYTCSCNQGYQLQNDGFTCNDIDDCIAVTCDNGGTCLDNVGSYTCSCLRGFTGKHCENDIDECVGFLNGGCEDICVNTVGSFLCQCGSNKTINNDGFSCSGDERTASVFARHGIVRKHLPRGCSTILLTRCTEGRTVDIFMSSTSHWYQLQSNKSVIYTFGIVFVEINSLSLPVSISGLDIVKHNNDFAIVTGRLAFGDDEGIAYGEERTADCVTFQITPRDIHDFLTSSSFMKTFYDMLYKFLPDWLGFSQEGTNVLSLNDLHSDLLHGKDIQKGECRGAPLYDNRLYTVLRFGSSFALTLYGDKVIFPSAIRNEQFCFIIDICRDLGGSVFLIVPEVSRGILNKFDLFRNLKEKYGFELLPVGLGLSLFKHINVHVSTLQLWNGDDYFNYRIMPEANLWFGGGAAMTYSGTKFSFRLEAKSNIFVSIPSAQNILKSIFLDEWNVLLKMSLLGSIGIRFRLFGNDHNLSLQHIGTSEISAYASVGGASTRVWCGQNANPAGLFFSLMVDINPFKEIPILKHGLFDFNNRVYAYIATDPALSVNANSNINIVADLIDVKEHLEYFINTTVRNVIRYISLLVSKSQIMLHDLQKSAIEFLETLELFRLELKSGNILVIPQLIQSVSGLWTNGIVKLQKDTEIFIDSIEHTTVIAKHNFSSLISRDINLIKDNLQNVLNKLVSQALGIFKDIQGFGLRYKGNLQIFHLNIVGLEIELVYSVDQLGACSHFNKVYSLLNGEQALRIYAVLSSGLFRIAPFLRLNAGGGVGIAMSIDSPVKIVAQLHAEASLLGIRGTVDVFLTENGHYFFLEGNIWNTFKTSLKVSFESRKNLGIVDTFSVSGKFGANAGDGNSFQDSYLDGLRKLTRKLADEADKRISQVQNTFTSAQKGLTKAQNWLEEKKDVMRSANSAFDRAVRSLESAKRKLEEAKRPFRNAMSKLNEAQRKVDNLCRIKHCRRICVPGLKCRICWKKVWFFKIPYPCCHFTSCMFSFPDPICVVFNLGCRAIRALAYVALEAAKFFVRIPMLALDAAKLLVSGAQFLVDKSRVVLDIAVGALDLAQIGLEGAKSVLEGAKYALEAVKKVVRWGLKALDLIIRYGLQSIIDVRNCGFEIKVAIYDTTVFHVMCEVNMFRQGFKTVKLGVNFGNPIQSIWQAAKGTIDTFVDASDLSGRKKREIKHEAISGLHKVIRETRNANIDAADFDFNVNETIDTVFKTSGFKQDASVNDYENRVEVFQEKCDILYNAHSFFSDALAILFEMSNETVNTLNNASSLEDSLEHFHIDDIISNFSIDHIGINKDTALQDFNISIEDLNGAIDEAKGNFTSDPLLSGIDGLTRDAKIVLKNQTDDVNNMKITDHWLNVMENETSDYFPRDMCISFLDCAHFAVVQMYGLFDAENLTDMSKSLDAISRFEDLFLDLTGNTSHTIIEVYDMTNEMTHTLKEIKDNDVFCSEPPKILFQMENQNVTKGSMLRIACNVTGSPAPQIWWYRDEEYLSEQHNQVLEIYNVSYTDGRKYRCIAGNIVANLSSGLAEIFVSEDTPESLTLQPTLTADVSLINSTTDGHVVRKSVNKNNKDSTLDLTVLLGSTIPAFVLIVAIGVASAWRIHVRNKARKSNGHGSTASLNMVRPTVQKPTFETKVTEF